MDHKIPYGPQANFSVFAGTLVEMNWQEVRAAADRKALVLLSIGTVEAHGPHMDLSPDFYLSTLSCRFLQQELSEIGIEALIAPPVYWGICRDLAKYPGTFSVRPETMKGLLGDILASLQSWGFHDVFVSNAHGDPEHVEVIRGAIADVNGLPGFSVRFLWDLNLEVESSLEFPPMREERFEPDVHAGAMETAQMMTYFPEKVRPAIAETLSPQSSFHPLAYCGDPASYGLEINLAEYASVDSKMDALKIKKLLNENKG